MYILIVNCGSVGEVMFITIIASFFALLPCVSLGVPADLMQFPDFDSAAGVVTMLVGSQAAA